MRALHAKLDKGIGVFSTDGFLDTWGPPQERQTYGEREFWIYVLDRNGQPAVTQTRQRLTRYDRITLEFGDGTLVKWTAEIRR